MYPGFKFINKLPSINEQRLIQRKFLVHILASKQLKMIKFLSAGVGDGEELDFLFASSILKSAIAKVICIDILNSYFNPYSLSNLSNVLNKTAFIQEDVRNIQKRFNQGEFDIIQCGFLMHEIKYENKNDVLINFFNLLKPNGYLIYSDIFADNHKRQSLDEELLRIKSIERIYNSFIKEAIECVKNGAMASDEWNLLCGDGIKEGLLKSMKKAMDGLDDYYEPLDKARFRLRDCGYWDIMTYANKKNDHLFVIGAKKVWKI